MVILVLTNQEENKMSTISKPECYDETIKDFLDDLRESGSINMFGASPYLEEIFDLSKQEARECLSYWMKTYAK